MEVVISLAIFAGAAAIVHLGLSRSLQSASRLRMQARAENLALTKLAEIQAGLAEATGSGPNSYEDESEDLAGWQWTVETVAVSGNTDAPPMQRVTVTVERPDGNIVHRLVQWLPDEGGGR
jgi:type II secretory pathway pseudopilin PulG